MNINKTLCKYFDIDNKGYVTVGNIMEHILKLGVAVVLVFGLLYCIYRGILDIIAMVDGTFDPITSSGIHFLAGGMGFLFIGLVSIFVIVVLVVSISEIKIAKCELKKDDDEKKTQHEITIKDGICYYRNIKFEQHNGRYIIISNSDLLKLGICTPETIQRGHKGYTSLATLMTRIDKGLGD